jgi:hypothetical protein
VPKKDAQRSATGKTPRDPSDRTAELSRDGGGKQVHSQDDGDESNGDKRNVPLTGAPKWEHASTEKA